MKTVCPKDMCTACCSCEQACTKQAIHIERGINTNNAVIDPDRCVDCGLCSSKCPVNNPLAFRTASVVRQGWTTDHNIRKNSASGGLATEIARQFIVDDGVVAGCVFSEGDFVFSLIDDEKDIGRISGSRYVKSNPQGIYKEIKACLVSGKKVLFIGLPCQVAGVIRYVGEKWTEHLYTIDLICHGTPSLELLKIYLQENNININECIDIQFRKKNRFQVIVDGDPLELFGVCDSYTMAFLQSLSYTENCYSCQYAQRQRISDLTLGDSWGTNVEQKQARKGVSLVLCQTPRGEELLKVSQLDLKDVDVEAAFAHNKQLNHPSVKHKKYDAFFADVAASHSVEEAVRKNCFEMYFKQLVKKILIRMKIMKY